jgi:hypothetical protein
LETRHLYIYKEKKRYRIPILISNGGVSLKIHVVAFPTSLLDYDPSTMYTAKKRT